MAKDMHSTSCFHELTPTSSLSQHSFNPLMMMSSIMPSPSFTWRLPFFFKLALLVVATSSVLWLAPLPLLVVTAADSSSSSSSSVQRSRKHILAAFLPKSSSVAPPTNDNEIEEEEEEEEVWYEIRPSHLQYELDPAWSATRIKKPSRKLLWHGRYDHERTWVPTTRESSNHDATNDTTTHPLRHKCWSLQVQWTGRLDKQLPKQLQLEFDIPTGYCLARNADDVVGLGCWQMYPWGVWFTLVDASGSVEYTFVAQLHLNPFGDHAKFMQGSIVRQTLLGGQGVEDVIQDDPLVRRRRPWFRPVVGQFSGRGK